MLPEDFPDNVIPLRPRQLARDPKAANSTAVKSATIKSFAAKSPSPVASPSVASTSAASTSAASTSAAMAKLHHPPLEPSLSLVVQDQGQASGRPHGFALNILAVPEPLAAETSVPPEKETAMPSPQRSFRWSHFGMILVAAFVLGIAIGWGAVAIGAQVLGVWPHGFPLYAMLIGGGVTMMLTAGLMTAVFYSDSSGHDDSVYQFHPEKRQDDRTGRSVDPD
jgi:hypothetical protein